MSFAPCMHATKALRCEGFHSVASKISLNLHKMGIIGTHAERFLHKIRLCCAQRQPYRYDGVYTEVEGVPVVYLGDSAGSL